MTVPSVPPVPPDPSAPSVLRPITAADHAEVLELNERHVDLLAPLAEPRLVQLASWADRAAVIDVDGRFRGFVLTFASGSPYDGDNFRWFGERYPQFCYLDRVVVHDDFRRRGLATAVYDELEADAARTRPVLTLEVNIEPPNEPSLAFHRARGFVEVGRRTSDVDHVVTMMVKQLH